MTALPPIEFEVVAWSAIRSGAAMTVDTRQPSGTSRRFTNVSEINVEGGNPHPVLTVNGAEIRLVLLLVKS